MLIIAISPHQTIAGLAPTMYHANTPHSTEQFEHDPHPTLLTLREFMQHLACLPLTIGKTTFKRATREEYEEWVKLFS